MFFLLLENIFFLCCFKTISFQASALPYKKGTEFQEFILVALHLVWSVGELQEFRLVAHHLVWSDQELQEFRHVALLLVWSVGELQEFRLIALHLV